MKPEENTSVGENGGKPMYVNPFWFGVLATLAVEFLIAFVRAAIQRKNGECDDER